MCCGMSPRALLILISCWAIIQSIIYLVFSTIGILIKNCNFSMEDSQFDYAFYLSYFRDGSCGDINWGILGLSDVALVPEITGIATRTGTFLYAYLILSCVWIVSSMSLIVATFTPCLSLLCLKLFSFPWVVTCGGVLILDVVATVYHIIDITNTTTLEGFLSFIGFADPDAIVPSFNDFPTYLTALPSVTMMIVSIRAFLFWAVNVSCLIYVIRGVQKMIRNELMKKRKPIRPDFGYGREFPRPEAQSPSSFDSALPPMTNPSRYNDPSPNNQYYDNSGFTADPLQQQTQQPNLPGQRYGASAGNFFFVSETRSVEPLKGGVVGPISDDGMSGMSSRISNARSFESVEDASRASSNLGNRSQVSDRTIDYENDTQSPADMVSYLSGDSAITDNSRRNQGGRSSGTPQSLEPPPVLPKPTKLLNPYLPSGNQYPQYIKQNQQIREEEVQPRNSFQAQPDELKNQKPWSYFQDPEGQSRPQRQRYNDEPLPPVPVPDYTMHFPKRNRPPTKPKPQKQAAPLPPQQRPLPVDDNTDNPNERWSGPEYTY